MVKVLLKKSILVMMIVFASVLCLQINNNQIKNVYADELGTTVSLTTATDSSDFVKGTVEGYGDYPVGSLVTLTATPSEGCYFVCWEDGEGNVISDINPYSFTISANTQVKAVFDFTEYHITDNFGSFIINELAYEYDGNRFDDASTVSEYPRAEIQGDFIVGNFYYNDIVSLKYVIKDSSSFVKEFTSSSFIINKKIMLIAVDADGQILWTETNNVKNEELKGILVSSYTFDYDVYDYVIVTNTNVGDKYVATEVVIKSQIKNDLNIRVTENNLMLIKMLARLKSDGAEYPYPQMDIANVANAVNFEYGYYGKITDYDIIAGLNAEEWYYLVESNANYKLILSDNENYVYLQTNETSDKIVQGYFSASISGFEFIFEKRGYEIKFEEIIKTATGYKTPDEKWCNLSSVSAYSGYTVKAEYIEGSASIKVFIEGEEKFAFSTNNIYGYSFLGFSSSNNLDEGNTSIEHTISNAEGTTLYIVLEQVDYNFVFGVADSSMQANEYLYSRITNLPQNRVYNRLDNVSLTATVPQGFNNVGWVIIYGEGIPKTLSETSFVFIPESAETNITVLLMLEYEYFDYIYKLDGSVGVDNVADIQLNVIDHFTINEDKTKLTIHGTTYNHLSVDEDWSQELTKTADIDTNTIVFASLYVSAIVYLTDGECDYLEIQGKRYLYIDEVFKRYSGVRTNIEASFANRVVDGVLVYNIKLENVTVDDLIFTSASIDNNYNSTYKFLHFTKVGTNQTIAYKSYNNSVDPIYYYLLSSYTSDTEIVVKYVAKSGKLIVKSGVERGCKSSNLEFVLSSGSFKYITADFYYELDLEGTQTVSVKVKKSLITYGYAFLGAEVLFADNTSDSYILNNSSNITTNADYYIFSFAYDKTTYDNSTITINFAEIEYTVTLDKDNADITVTDEDNKSLLAQNNTFILSWSVIDKGIKINVNSSKGYYIKNAYFSVDSDANRIGTLIGVNTSETVREHLFTEQNLNLVSSLADSNNSVTFYLEEDRRIFNVTVKYVISNGVNIPAAYYKDATTTCSYTIEDPEVTNVVETKTASQSSTEFILEFLGIKYEQELRLKVDDAGLNGVYFSGLTNIDNYIINEQGEYVFELLEDIVINANFVAMAYQFNFNYLNEDGSNLQDYSNVVLTVNDETSSNFYIGDEIKMSIAEKTGYQLISVYYVNGTQIDVFDSLVLTSSDYKYVDGEYSPLTYLSTTRDEQKNKDNRTIQIYIVFKEKLYTISSLVNSKTSNNSTGCEVDSWIKDFTVKYKNGEEYVEKEASSDGKIYYKTNSNIQITFANALDGINLYDIYLGDKIYTVKLASNKDYGEFNLAGQIVKISKVKTSYTLEFALNSAILESVNTDADFKIILNYNIKSYTITLKAVSLQNQELYKDYKLVMSYEFGSNSGSNNGTDALTNKKAIPYGTESWWKVTDKGQVIDGVFFRDIYKFAYFQYSYTVDGKLETGTFEPLQEDVQGNSYAFYLNKLYGENLLWELIAPSTKIDIVAVYVPLITYNMDIFTLVDGKYVKTVDYNGIVQELTGGSGKDNDVYFAESEFGEIVFTYRADALVKEPKNAGTYTITYKFIKDGVVYDYQMSDEVELVICKVRLSVNFVGEITKEYDGQSRLHDTSQLKQSSGSNVWGFYLSGFQAEDTGLLDLSNVSAVFSDLNAGTGLDVTISGIELIEDLKTNYFIYLNELQKEPIVLQGVGTITPKKLSINENSFSFYNIVYKEITENDEVTLKYTRAEELLFNEELFNSDACYINNELLQFSLNTYSIGYRRIVTVNLLDALDGEDKGNYTIDNLMYYIDIHPYEIEYELEGFGRFTITDFDELCVIPIETSINGLTVTIISNGHQEYPDLYAIIESRITKNEKLFNFYKFNLTMQSGNSVNLNNLKGAYITFTEVDKMSSLYDVGDVVDQLVINRTENVVKIKITDQTSNTFCILQTKSYFAIWKIILIVGLSLLLLIIIIVAIIIYRRIRAKKADAKHKI